MPWVENRQTRAVYEFSSMASFVLGQPYSVYRLPFGSAGTSLVAYDGHLYYVRDKTRNIVKYRLADRKVVAEEPVDNALEINYSSLLGSSDIDLAIDEYGLWAVYSTGSSGGNVVLSKISTEDLSIMSTWQTDIEKENILNTFIICGTLYVIDSETLRVHEKFDTATNESAKIAEHVNITIPWKDTNSVNYNPLDNMLYVWSTSQAIIFTLDTKTPPQPSAETRVVDDEIQHSTVILNNINETTVTSDGDSSFSTVDFKPVLICPATVRRGMIWPATDHGTVAELPCPEGARGSVIWKCEMDESTGNATWDSAGPSFESCSTWTIAIDEELQLANSSQYVHKIAKDLSHVVQKLKESDTGIEGHDLSHASMIMSEISNLAKFSVSDGNGSDSEFHNPGDAEKRDKLLELNQALVNSGSDLVSEDMAETWDQLDMEEKCDIGNRIMDTVEESAFLLAGQDEQLLDVGNITEVDRVVEKENILVGIKVQKISNIVNKTEEKIVFPDTTLLGESGPWNDVTDSIQISTGDIVNNQENGKATVVFALYDRLAELMDGTEGEDEATVNSKIVSATIESTSNRIQLRSPAIITLAHVKPSNESHTCVYWNPHAENLEEKWLTDGCTKVSSNSTHTVCACEHLTSFAVLINHRGFVFKDHMTTLDLLTWIGLSSSLVCLTVCILTFLYFKSLHCTRTTIHTNLCVCLFLSQLVFLVGIDMYHLPTMCSVIAGVLHYCFLATFTWMALEGFQLYVMLVEVFERNTSIIWYYLFGYGVPAIFVGLSAGLNPAGYGTETACWLKTDVHGEMGTIGGFAPFIWAFIGPASLIAIGNIAFICLTAVTMYSHGRKYIYYTKLQAIRSAMRGTLALLCLLGTTWIVGIIWWWDGMVILSYLFCILNAFQGVYIFIFHCLMHNKVRYEYRKFLSKCLGNDYIDLPNSSSLTMKYSGMRRRSTQTYYSQKQRNQASFKGSVHSNHDDQTFNKHHKGPNGTQYIKSFNDASEHFTSEDRNSMQILLTRRDSLVSPSAIGFQSPITQKHHPRTLSTQSCPGNRSSLRQKPPRQKIHSFNHDEAAPLKRSYSEKRSSSRRYNAPVSDSVNRILKSARSTHSVILPNRYTFASDPHIMGGSLKSNGYPSKPPTTPEAKSLGLPTPPVTLEKKEAKPIDKRLSRLKTSSHQFKRSSSMNSAEKKRKDLKKFQLQMEMQPSSSVPDLMSQLSAKIESRDISNVLLMYLDKDGTLNRSKMEKYRSQLQ